LRNGAVVATIDMKIIKDPYQNESGNLMRKHMEIRTDRWKFGHRSLEEPKGSIATFVSAAL